MLHSNQWIYIFSGKNGGKILKEVKRKKIKTMEKEENSNKSPQTIFLRTRTKRILFREGGGMGKIIRMVMTLTCI